MKKHKCKYFIRSHGMITRGQFLYLTKECGPCGKQKRQMYVLYEPTKTTKSYLWLHEKNK